MKIFQSLPLPKTELAGSGKTTTALHLLAQAPKQHLPLLVLSLTGHEERKIIPTETALGMEMRIYTPGNERRMVIQ